MVQLIKKTAKLMAPKPDSSENKCLIKNPFSIGEAENGDEDDGMSV